MIKLKVHKQKRRNVKYIQDLHRVSVTESVVSSTESHVTEVTTGMGSMCIVNMSNTYCVLILA